MERRNCCPKLWLIFLNTFVEVIKPTIRRYPLGGGDKNNYLDEDARAPALLQTCQISKVTRVHLKGVAGRGRKQSDWVVHVHAVLMDEFLRLQKNGLKFSNVLLGSLARGIIRKEEGVFNLHYRDARDQKMMIRKILPR